MSYPPEWQDEYPVSLAHYWKEVRTGEGIVLVVCPICSATVYDRKIHAEWHHATKTWK